MRPLIIPALFFALLACPAPPARADLPGPLDWIVPSHVTLVGLGPAGPDSARGHFSCVIRDLAQQPVAGAAVVFDFFACTNVAIASDQRDPRLLTSCPGRTVIGMTDEHGIARFTIIGAGTTGPVHPPHSLKIYVDGILAGSPSLAVLDRDGVGGLTSLDLSLWGADLFSGANPERADLDGSGYVDGVDISRWAAAFFSGNNVLPAGPYCP